MTDGSTFPVLQMEVLDKLLKSGSRNFSSNWQSQDAAIDGICAAVAVAFDCYLEELLGQGSGPLQSDSPSHLVVPVLPSTCLDFRCTDLEDWLEVRGLTFEELVFQEEVKEVIRLAPSTQQATTGPRVTVLSAVPTAAPE
eukprot:CAMPEP_0178457314 /NCGR_PEP_ID=MMETSP0689_2-20121128/46952_1 /TAXON_ID=160604 /ORGANISM="Amphidinium massartii, Strain CS-259" /LENGTH=139 /DNA_ID=CAMNT_0020083559 /DNA_START=45 /DNA_END=462 /DNA_ORIENTATION=+